MSRHRILLLVAASLSATLWAYACGDGATEPPTPPPDPPRPTTVAVTPATAQLGALGATVQLSAEVRDQNGQAMAGAAVTWASGSAAVATVSGSGLVTAAGNGTATITATAGSASGTATVTVAQSTNPDRAALVALYDATDGPNWVNNENWLTHAPLGEWYGVETNGVERVISLVLSGNGLEGMLPGLVGDLSELESLKLGNNGLSGSIPPELGKLVKLERLELARNRLSGLIPPELGNLSELRYMWLADTDLTGPVPPEFGNLRKLSYLYLGPGRLSGSIPPELGELASLRRLSLQNNAFTGKVPAELGDLEGLIDLRLGNNHLAGQVPASVTRIAGLRYLSLQNNAGLCVSGTGDFVRWARAIETFEGPFCNEADVAALVALYEATGGRDWMNDEGWLGEGAIGLWHGVVADTLGRVVELDLAGNGLTGRLPAALGGLERVRVLRIGNNTLSGRLPLTLARLPLAELRYADTELCAPPDPSFQAWLHGIASRKGTGTECAPVSNRDALVVLYEATNGPNWTNGENWLTDAPLGEWHGVAVDREGRVTSLGLRENGLAGSIPPELSSLSRISRLRLNDNDLTGPIPPELGTLAELEVLNLGWNALTGPIPPELGNLSKLKHLRLDKSKLWARVRGFTGARDHGRVLTGPIPPELGNLSNLETLSLAFNGLTGEIPPELGNLANLTRLSLSDNDLTGPLPAELGGLASLEHLLVSRSGLTGSLPAELGGLASLNTWFANGNALSGPVPAELGGLARLENLNLSLNNLTGPVPAGLGGLARLENLNLSFNNLTGPVPPEFGGLASLRTLRLTDNTEMSGALPGSLTALEHLDDLAAEGTGLCAPGDAGIVAWLRRIPNRRIASCSQAFAAAYLTQAVQSPANPVPLVAGDDALLRVFPVASVATDAGIPPVRARFYLDDREVHVEDIAGKPGPLPTAVVEGSLETSANAMIPGSVIQPGLEMVVEIDPGRTLDPSLGLARRIPEAGRLTAEVHELPFHLTLVPFMRSARPDSLVLSLSRRIAADPHNHEALRSMALMPVPDDFGFTLHEPVWTSDNSNAGPYRELKVLQILEGAAGQHYMGMMTENGVSAGTWETRNSFIYVSDDFRERLDLLSNLIAHAMGHAMSLLHSPGCRPGHVDEFLEPSYPYSTGRIGVWGYDVRGGGGLIGRHRMDAMSICRRGTLWVSDYHFTKMYRHRLRYDRRVAAVTALLLWGGVNEAGVPFLEPAFVVDAAPLLPGSAGDYTVVGRAHDGRELFSLNFALWESPDAEGHGSFVFALPVRSEWTDALASITLSGPAGSVVLDSETDRPMAILRDPFTSQVRGFLRDVPAAALARGAAAGRPFEPGLEALFSRGIPPELATWTRGR